MRCVIQRVTSASVAIDGEIVFDHVNFHYNPNRPILKDISFTIKKGDHVGLVGHTGSGKSTIANLITRMYDTVSGTITSTGSETDPITVQLVGEKTYEVTVSGNSAAYRFENVAAGTYTLKVSKAGHNTQEYVLTVGTGSIIQNVTLTQVSSGNIAGDIDCNGLVNTDDVVALLKEIGKPVTVELGLQTVHDETAANFNRGYKTEVYFDALHRLKNAGIEVVTHIILGLPGESREMMLQTVDYLSGDHRPDGIKLQLLHVLEGTDLAKDWRAGAFRCMEMDEYFDILFECLSRLPEDMVIHRLTGDGPKKLLLAPLWTGDKKRVLNALNRELERRDIWQENTKK